MADSDLAQVDAQAGSGERLTLGHTAKLLCPWISPWHSSSGLAVMGGGGGAGNSPRTPFAGRITHRCVDFVRKGKHRDRNATNGRWPWVLSAYLVAGTTDTECHAVKWES